MFQAAIKSHSAGRLKEAEAIYRRILQVDPKQPHALHLLGVIAYQAGQAESAVQLISQAIALLGNIPDFHNNIGEAYRALGRYDEAITHYQRALTLEPVNPGAACNMGSALIAQGKIHDAIAAYKNALGFKPDFAEAKAKLGTALVRLPKDDPERDLDRGIGLLREGLRVNPAFTEGYVNLANALADKGEMEEAIGLYRQAIERDPADPNVHLNLAVVLFKTGEVDNARNALARALACAPDDPAFHILAGEEASGMGSDSTAISCFRRATELAPDIGAAHERLAKALQRNARYPAAIESYRRVLETEPVRRDIRMALCDCLSRCQRGEEALNVLTTMEAEGPDDYDLLCRIGETLQRESLFAEAAPYFFRAMDLDAVLPAARIGLVRTFARDRLEHYDSSTDRFLTTAFGWQDIAIDVLAPLTAAHLKLKFGLPGTAQEMQEENLDDGLIARLADDRLFVGFLSSTINCDPGLEVLLIRLRRRLADHSALADAPQLLVLAAALATQVGANEYVYTVAGEEAEKLDQWRHELEANDDWSAPSPAVQTLLLRYCLYSSPRALACRVHLASPPIDRWLPALRPLITEEVVNRERESDLAAALPELTPISDEISRAVARQYEENPYPRWLAATRRRPESPATILATRFPHFDPPKSLRGPVDVLIAGCGTGQHPIAAAAMIYKEANVLAVDLSRASLGYAARMAADLEAHNVTFAVADILELDGLDRQFDIIEAVGVLHHLRDPVAGWRTLRDRLRPDGVMMVGLYSRRSRRHIAALRARRDELGLSATVEGIRALRNRVMFDDVFAPYDGLLDSPDFYSMSGCRDLVFHVQEHHFTPREIADILDRLGLELIGLHHPTPEPVHRYRAAYPDDPTQTDLANWDRFEEANPKTFARLIRLWCRRR